MRLHTFFFRYVACIAIGARQRSWNLKENVRAGHPACAILTGIISVVVCGRIILRHLRSARGHGRTRADVGAGTVSPCVQRDLLAGGPRNISLG